MEWTLRARTHASCSLSAARLGVVLVVLLATALATLPVAALAGGTRSIAAPWDGRAYPARYDLRAHGRVSPVGRQAHHGTCWVFAGIGSLESCLLPGASLDLSENHLADFQGTRLRFEGRAPSTVSTAYFARWEGPVLEREDPYPRPGESREGLRAVRHVQDVLFLPGRSGPHDNEAVKWAVMQNGAVDAEMAHESSAFNASTSAYYSQSTDVDHHVCVVGWDDTYPAARFLRRPPGPGAFLIKNSWGPEYGQRGYFWVSYYDRMFGRRLAVFSGAEPVTDYDAIYQHDALGWSRSIGYGSHAAWFAARYSSGGDGRVTAVSFYTPGPGATYEVRVAASLGDVASAPLAGQGMIAVGGYHTVHLSAPAAVTEGADFVVAVRLTTPGSRLPIPVEHASKLIAPRPAVGRSFVSRDGSAWSDLRRRPGFGDSDVCLKAFVAANGAGDHAAPSVVLAAAEAQRGGPARLRFTLTDPPFSCGSAVVKLWLRDRKGNVLDQIRIPAVAVNEPDVWRLVAPIGRGSYRIFARAWDVAGHRQAVLSRATLTVR